MSVNHRPAGEAMRLRARNRVLEDALTKVWAWSNGDKNADELQQILHAADDTVQVMAALDRIEVGRLS